MSVLKKIGLFLGALLALVLVLGMVSPKDYNVERNTLIKASKGKIFPHVQYFQKR